MKNLARKVGVSIGAGVGLGLATLACFAQNVGYGTTTAITSVTSNIQDVGSVIAGVIAAILALMAALIGLGWGVRKFQKHVSGRKF